jgi:hypothetical protein
MNGTIKQLFTTEFGFDLDQMEIGKMYDVSEANIGIKAYNGKTGEDCFAKVLHAIKKDKQSSYRIKLEDRDDFEEPVAGRHMYAIMKSYDSNEMDFGFVENLIPGAAIVTIDGPSKIEKIEKLEDDYVYDVETETQNYYSNGILSHNTVGAHLPSTTGGTALKFFSSTRCRIQKMDVIKNGDNTIGIQISARNYKNKTSVPNRDALMDLYFQGGFNSSAEYFTFITKFHLLTHKDGTAWWSWIDTENRYGEGTTNKKGEFVPKEYKWQGAGNAQAWLEEHPDFYDELKRMVDKKLCVSNELDANNVDPEIEDAKEAGVRLTTTSEASKKEIADLASEALQAASAMGLEAPEDTKKEAEALKEEATPAE